MLLVARVIKVLIYKVMFLQTLSFADHALIILGAQTHFTSLPQKNLSQFWSQQLGWHSSFDCLKEQTCRILRPTRKLQDCKVILALWRSNLILTPYKNCETMELDIRKVPSSAVFPIQRFFLIEIVVRILKDRKANTWDWITNLSVTDKAENATEEFTIAEFGSLSNNTKNGLLVFCREPIPWFATKQVVLCIFANPWQNSSYFPCLIRT